MFLVCLWNSTWSSDSFPSFSNQKRDSDHPLTPSGLLPGTVSSVFSFPVVSRTPCTRKLSFSSLFLGGLAELPLERTDCSDGYNLKGAGKNFSPKPSLLPLQLVSKYLLSTLYVRTINETYSEQDGQDACVGLVICGCILESGVCGEMGMQAGGLDVAEHNERIRLGAVVEHDWEGNFA